MKNKILQSMKWGILCLLLLACTACAKKITVTVQDYKMSTDVDAKVGQTIEKVLETAQIELGEKDVIEPALDAKLAEDTTEIVIRRYACLTVKDGDQETQVDTFKGETIGDVLQQGGITVGEKDVIEPALDEQISKDQAEVTITRYAALTVTDSGETTEIDAFKGMTIADVLAQAGITVGEKDVTEPAMDTVLSEDQTEVTIKRYAKVTLRRNEEEQGVELVGGTVAEAIEQAGIQLEEKEEADEEMDAFLTDGMVISITKEKTVKLTVDGKTEEIKTRVFRVEEFLEEQNVKLGDDDELNVKKSKKLKDGMEVIVYRVEYKEEKVTETIDYSTIEQYSDSMDRGTSSIDQYGAEGEKEITYKVKYVDGEEDSREVVSEEIT